MVHAKCPKCFDLQFGWSLHETNEKGVDKNKFCGVRQRQRWMFLAQRSCFWSQKNNFTPNCAEHETSRVIFHTHAFTDVPLCLVFCLGKKLVVNLQFFCFHCLPGVCTFSLDT